MEELAGRVPLETRANGNVFSSVEAGSEVSRRQDDR